MAGDIGLFYGSSTCYTEIAAEKICAAIKQISGGAITVDIYDIDQQALTLANDYNWLILGIPTWDYGELQEHWEANWRDLDAIDWQGKVVALYGLGDQDGYPEWFLDALGYLWGKITSLGANSIGLWPTEGYRHTHSEALTEDQRFFVGLALDEDSEFELSDQRISAWCRQILLEFRDDSQTTGPDSGQPTTNAG